MPYLIKAERPKTARTALLMKDSEEGSSPGLAAAKDAGSSKELDSNRSFRRQASQDAFSVASARPASASVAIRPKYEPSPQPELSHWVVG
jgi:hypothetical protein